MRCGCFGPTLLVIAAVGDFQYWERFLVFEEWQQAHFVIKGAHLIVYKNKNVRADSFHSLVDESLFSGLSALLQRKDDEIIKLISLKGVTAKELSIKKGEDWPGGEERRLGK